MDDYRPEDFRLDWKQMAGSWIVVGILALVFLGYSVMQRENQTVSRQDEPVAETNVQVVSK